MDFWVCVGGKCYVFGVVDGVVGFYEYYYVGVKVIDFYVGYIMYV